MICARHDWWDAAPCPKCPVVSPDEPTSPLEAETVTVAVAPEAPQTDLVSAPVAAAGEEGLDIPDFLLRNKDGTFAHPELMVHAHDDTPTVCQPSVLKEDDRPVEAWSDAELMGALDDPKFTVYTRQPIYQELHRREDKRKALARIAVMKEKKAAKDKS